MNRRVKIGAAQYSLCSHQSWDEYSRKMDEWILAGVSAGAQLLVFPEYASLELVSLIPLFDNLNLKEQLLYVQEFAESYLELHRFLAQKYNVHILTGSFPLLVGGKYVNTTWFVYADGRTVPQEKNIMTRFEKDWGISSGKSLRVIDCELATIGVAICYDSEFPLLVRELSEAGAEIILVPSCTDSLAGYWRVRIACQARALENQCYVVQSPTIGKADWCKAIDENIGAAGIFAPPDVGFPDDGIVALGELNMPGWVYADIDLDYVSRVRNNGQVQNFYDWK